MLVISIGGLSRRKMHKGSRTSFNGLIRGVTGRTWRWFTSVRLAVVLILVLANLSLIGTLLIQVPAETAADPGEYAWWLENVVRPKLGFWTTPISFLGLFDVFHSYWFLGTGVLLVVNIIVCSLNRWKQIRNAVFSTRVRLGEGFYERGSNRAQFTQVEMSPETMSSAVREVLRGRRFRVRDESASQSIYIAADKNRFFRLGTYLSHLSIILFILGFLLGSFLGFRDKAFMVPEGSIREVGHGTGLSLSLESFVDEYWPAGPPKDYRSEVTLYEDDKEVKKGLIRVNHPLIYGGVRFYQSFFGSAAMIQVQDASGQLVYEDGVALGWLSGQKPVQRPTGTFDLTDVGLTAYVLAPAQGAFDPLLSPGQIHMELYRDDSSVLVNWATLEQGEPAVMEDLQFTFVRERQFSGFQVSKDPGNLLIWVSSGLFVLGLVFVFYFPHRQVWAHVEPHPDGGSRVSLRTTSTRSFAVASDFENLVRELEGELSQKNEQLGKMEER